MKSVGEAMGIGRTFAEAFVEGPARARGRPGRGGRRACTRGSRPSSSVRAAGRAGSPVYRRVDSCAGEVEARSNYFYSTWGEDDDEPPPAPGRSVVILGSGPNRIGQGIEFDYCCVHAAQSFRAQGYEAVMVNCNPETVSTDYDTSDRLYFEPLDEEAVLAVCERERPDGVVHPVRRPDAAQARAGDRARRLPHPRDAVRRGRPRRGPRALRRGSPRELGVRCPEWGIAASPDEAVDDRRADRLPGARAPVVRARRPRDAGLLLGGRGAREAMSPRVRRRRRSSTASSRTRSSSTSTRCATAPTRTSPR